MERIEDPAEAIAGREVQVIGAGPHRDRANQTQRGFMAGVDLGSMVWPSSGTGDDLADLLELVELRSSETSVWLPSLEEASTGLGARP